MRRVGASPPKNLTLLHISCCPLWPWVSHYWLAISAFLGVISIAWARRGADDGWSARRRLARLRMSRLIPAAAVCLLVALASGIWFDLGCDDVAALPAVGEKHTF